MKRFVVLATALTLLVACTASAQVTKSYGGATMNAGAFFGTHFNDVWDLTCGDLVLSYTIDMSKVTQTAAYETSYTQVGLRQVGAADFNPGPWDTYQGGAGGWMNSLVGDLATNPNDLDLDDKHNLAASGNRGEKDYDVYSSNPLVVVAPPIGSFDTSGFWYDRDGVDPWQSTKAANTGGTYDIRITYRAIDPGLGSMIAMINGNGTDWVEQEIRIGGVYYPAGLSFKGDMTQMQVFYGNWGTAGAGGTVALSNLTATGCPAIPEPVFLQFGALMGLSGLGVLKLRRR